MLKRLFVVGLVLFIFSSTVWCEMSAGRGTGKLSHISMMLNAKLQLTDEQKTQIEKLTLEADEKSIQLSADLEILQIELQSLLTKDELDQKEILKKIDKASEIGASVQKNTFTCLIDIQKVLTPEQKKTYKEIFKLIVSNIGNKSEREMPGIRPGKFGASEGEKKEFRGNLKGEKKDSQTIEPQGSSSESSDEEILNLLLGD